MENEAPLFAFLRDRDLFVQRFVLAEVLGPPPSKRRRGGATANVRPPIPNRRRPPPPGPVQK